MAVQAKFDGPKPFQKKKGLVDKRGQNCGHCGKTGHTKEVCFGIYGYPDWYKSLMDQRKRNTTSTNRVLNATEEKESVQNAIKEQTISEIIRTNLQRLLRKETPELADSINENYEDFLDGSKHLVKSIGTITLHGQITLTDVLYVPGLKFNLLSEPKSFSQASKIEEWEKAMQVKLHALEKNIHGISPLTSSEEGYRSLYGLKQASRQWNQEFTSKLVDYGFIQSKNDHCLFTKSTTNGFITLLVYVDDVLIAGTSKLILTKVKSYLEKLFTIKDPGMTKYFLGLEIARSAAGLAITQTKYIGDIISDTRLNNAKAVTTPLPVGIKFSIEVGEPLSNPEAYRSGGGAIEDGLGMWRTWRKVDDNPTCNMLDIVDDGASLTGLADGL
ncbi:UNVERIFIED_CONTAM: putative mitochondrial protein [Sesamum calycinum]|uniref:Mitochondrial protein n=1 Tax=Sesamum calycinum TaxID=2727403 RepID=A0AAW2M9G2_9LAMI